MNKNDLIRRGDVKAKKVYCREWHEYVVPVAEIDWLPAVPQPMSAVEFIDTMIEIRNQVRYCTDCPLDKRLRNCCLCEYIPDIVLSPDELVSDVQKWAQEHTEEAERSEEE